MSTIQILGLEYSVWFFRHGFMGYCRESRDQALQAFRDSVKTAPGHFCRLAVLDLKFCRSWQGWKREGDSRLGSRQVGG